LTIFINRVLWFLFEKKYSPDLLDEALRKFSCLISFFELKEFAVPSINLRWEAYMASVMTSWID